MSDWVYAIFAVYCGGGLLIALAAGNMFKGEKLKDSELTGVVFAVAFWPLWLFGFVACAPFMVAFKIGRWMSK